MFNDLPFFWSIRSYKPLTFSSNLFLNQLFFKVERGHTHNFLC